MTYLGDVFLLFVLLTFGSCQRSVQNPVKHEKWSFWQKYLTAGLTLPKIPRNGGQGIAKGMGILRRGWGVGNSGGKGGMLLVRVFFIARVWHM